MNKFRIIIPGFLLVFLAVTNFMAQDDNRAVQTWKVQKYDISVTLPQETAGRSMGSTAVITLKNILGRPVSSLTLRISSAAEITTVKINDSVTDFTKSEEKTGASTALQRIAMRFAAVAPDGVLTATVDYKLNVKDNTGLNALSPDGSQVLPLSFWYPTPTSWFFTRGGDWAPFRLKIAGGAGVSSGALTAGTYDEKLNGQPFLIAGNWDTVTTAGVDVMMPKGTTADGQKRGAELAALFSDARTFMAGVLGPAPDEPLRIVSVKRGAGFSGGGTVLVEDAVFRRTRIDSVTAMNIAEAAAKIWLGDAVAIAGDGHGVIREGMSRYLATQFIESKFGRDVADAERTRQRTAYASVSKRDAPMGQVSPLEDFYYAEVANKGAMVWRIIARRIGQSDFSSVLKANMQDGSLTLNELRDALSTQKDLLDYFFNEVTDMDLLAGLPQTDGADTKVALRNTGGVDATVTVTAFGAAGQVLEAPTTIRARSFGEVVFKAPFKVVRAEVDTEKLYPQMDYSDDIAPREFTESDTLLAVKQALDKKDYAGSEKMAVNVLRDMPRYDEVRVLHGRALLGVGRTADAEREFSGVLDEKLPTAKSMSWANAGLAEAASSGGRKDQAVKFAERAIAEDADYGASFAARAIRNKLGIAPVIDPGVKAFFTAFDSAAISKRRTDVEALIMPGEVTKFAGGVSGSAEQWQTQILQVDRIDQSTVLVEANVTLRLLSREAETGTAVFRLARSGSGWKLSGVDLFEVR